jgi:tetratricopeptide (TPR) repeat protein
LESLEKQAVQAAEKNDLDQALNLFNECITIEPNYASAYNNRAQLYRMQNEVEKAIADLDKVIGDVGTGQPKVLRQAYTQRAILKRQQGDLSASREDFEMGAKLGNPVARNIAVKENPYAKMCNQVMMEVMKGELTKGLE